MRLVWTSQARNDLLEIDRYWLAIAPDQGDELLDRIADAARFLTGLPQVGAVLEDLPVRKWTVRGTRYLLLYRLQGESIEILRVHHHARNWREDLA